MTRDEALVLIDSARSLLSDLRRLWPETDHPGLTEDCGELLDLICEDVDKLDVGLDH